MLEKVVLNVKELQKELNVSRSLAYQLVRQKDFPKIRVGRRILIPIEELKNWIKKSVNSIS